MQDTFSQQVHELHRLVVRQRRLCAVCEDPASLNAHLAAEQAAAAQKLAVALQARANIQVSQAAVDEPQYVECMRASLGQDHTLLVQDPAQPPYDPVRAHAPPCC